MSSDPPTELSAITSSLMAIQHILIEKGICSAAELSKAHRAAQEKLVTITSLVSSDMFDNSKLLDALKDLAGFVGGDGCVADFNDALKKFTTESKE